MKTFFIFLVCIFSLSTSHAESMQYPNTLAEIYPSNQSWNQWYISFPSSFTAQLDFHTEEDITHGAEIPHTDSLIEALTRALFWKKVFHPLELTNQRRTNAFLHTTIDILGESLRFKHDMQWGEYPTTLSDTHQMFRNTQTLSQYTFQTHQAGKYHIQLYPLNWEESHIILSSPVRNIKNPLFVLTDPVLDMHIQSIILQSKPSSLHKNITNIKRKYKKILLDTFAENISIPMNTQELSTIKKELFPWTGTMQDAVDFINTQPRRDVYLIFPYYEIELDISTPWEYTLEISTEVYKEPKPEHWTDEPRE